MNKYNNKWQMRFEHFNHIYEPGTGYFSLIKSPSSKLRLKAMGVLDQNKINFNFWALFFGPLWYMTRGMAFKGLLVALIMSICFFANAVFVQGGVIGIALGWLPALIFASRANYDYYLSEIHGISKWQGFWSKWWSVPVLFLVLVIEVVTAGAIANGDTGFQPIQQEIIAEQMFREDVSGVWSDGSTQMIIDLTDTQNAVVKVDVGVFKIDSFGSYDKVNHIMPLNVSINGEAIGIWTIRQVWDQEGETFNLTLAMNDGSMMELEFVRSL